MDLFGELTGEELRDMGMASVLGHQCSSWQDRVYAFALGFIQNTSSFIAEDIRMAWEKSGGPMPSHHNAWGAVINLMSRAGKIKSTGQVRKTVGPSRHSRRSLIWEKV